MFSPAGEIGRCHQGLGPANVVNGAGLAVASAEVPALVGECGCGRSATAGVAPRPDTKEPGQVSLKGAESRTQAAPGRGDMPRAQASGEGIRAACCRALRASRRVVKTPAATTMAAPTATWVSMVSENARTPMADPKTSCR